MANEQDLSEWKDCPTLEQWAEKMLRQGYPEIVAAMMRALPESSREKYREIWRRIVAERGRLK